jgi:TP901-1 family phage major tail protein
MTAHRGKDLLLRIGDGAPVETFTTVAGLRARTLSLNAQSVDVTHSESEGGWRELLSEASVRQASLSGAGVFLSGAAANAVRAAFFSGATRTWRVVIPGLGEITGPFLIANLDYSGPHDGELQCALALESAGALSFAEAP